MRTETEARKEGQELLSRMRGDGWTLRVHENTGWHYCVQLGPASVYPSYARDDGRFSCLLADEDTQGRCGFGVPAWTTRGSYEDPNEAVAVELASARAYADKVNRALALLDRFDQNAELRSGSGEVESSNRVVGFLYLLMRDYLPAGTVEKIVREVVADRSPMVFTNGWVAEYAKDLCTRMEVSDGRQT